MLISGADDKYSIANIQWNNTRPASRTKDTSPLSQAKTLTYPRYAWIHNSKKAFHKRKKSLQEGENKKIAPNDVKIKGRDSQQNKIISKTRPSSCAKMTLNSKLIDKRVRNSNQRKLKPARKDRSHNSKTKKLKPYNPISKTQLIELVKENIEFLRKTKKTQMSSKSSKDEKNKVGAIYAIVTSLRKLGKEEFKISLENNNFNDYEISEIDNICIKFAPEFASTVTQFRGRNTISSKVSTERDKRFKSINDYNKDMTSSMSKFSYNPNESSGNMQIVDITNFTSDGYWNPALK